MAIASLKSFLDKKKTSSAYSVPSLDSFFKRKINQNQSVLSASNNQIGIKETLKQLSPQVISEAGGKVGSSVWNFGKEMLQATARSGGSVALTAATPFVGTKTIKSSELPTPERIVKDFIFGKEDVKSLQQRIAEAELSQKTEGVKIMGKQLATPEQVKGKELPLAFLAVGGMVGLDFTGGGGEKNVVKALATTKDVGFISKILKQINVADDLIPDVAKKLATISDEKEIKAALDKITELQKTTKLAEKGTKTLDPLSQEARKYKSAEEFVNAQPTAYHGTSGDFETFKPFNKVPAEFKDSSGQHTFGTYFADNKDLAGQFGKNILERKLNVSKPFDVSNVGSFDELVKKLGLNTEKNAWEIRNMKSTSYFDKLGGGNESSYRALEALNKKFDIVKQLKKQGYDGLIFADKENGILGKTTVVFDTNKILTKSQLTDIYNQAVGKEDILYHGTPEKFSKFDTNISEGGATWFTKDKNEILSGKSGAVQRVGKKMNIMERKLKPNIKLATPEMADKLYTDQLIAEGYRGVKYPAEKGGQAEWVKLWFPNEDTIPFNQAVKGGVEEVKEVATKIPVSIKESIETKIPVKFTQAKSTVEKLWESLKKAGPVRKEQEALYATERAKRTARMAAMGQKVPGEKGFFAQLGQLKGEMPKAQFDAIRKDFSQAEVDSLFDLVENSKLLPFEKLSAKGGLSGLFEGRIPTSGELDLMKEVFPKELIEEILNKRPFSQKLFGALGQVINTPRAIMASIDLSAPFRQGIFMIGRPKQFFNSFGNMFKYALSEKAYMGLDDYIKAKPTYEAMRKARLAITDLGSTLTGREETIMASLPERIPIFGRLFRGSNRAYTGFLNKLRADVFDDIVSKAMITGKELSDIELEGLGKFINSATGRGELPNIIKNAGPMLNATFFSPKLMASRINMLNPYFYATLPPLARKEALKSLFSFAGITGGLLGLAKLGGADVGVDPRNADFGKIKVGNTRYDVLGGFQQYIRLAAQLLTGEIVSSTTGRTITLGEGYKPLTRKDILFRFFENKESPIASFITGMMSGTSATGEDFDLPSEVISRFIPMVIQDLYDLSQEEGADKIFMGLPGIFGVGVQTYGKQELTFGENPIGEPTSQIRPVQELSDKIRDLVLGKLPLGSSKSFSVEAYFDQLSNIPRDEAADIFNKIAQSNPDLAKQIRDVVKDRELGISVKDKDLKSKGVASGDRALSIKKEFDKLESKEEKAALWAEYVKKGVITKEVARQLNILFKQ